MSRGDLTEHSHQGKVSIIVDGSMYIFCGMKKNSEIREKMKYLMYPIACCS
jgi:hypothetical protein